MAWPTIFKLLGFGALFAADALKTENAKYQAKNIAPRPELQPTRFGFPEYMRPADLYGNKLTDQQIIENNRKCSQWMIDQSNKKIAEYTKSYEKNLANGNLEAAEYWKRAAEQQKRVKAAYTIEKTRYD